LPILLAPPFAAGNPVFEQAWRVAGALDSATEEMGFNFDRRSVIDELKAS
jgi:hypothetical protein